MKNKLIMTNQRLVILEELGKSQQHHTAYSLLELVREKMPMVNLATMYRNLETLSEVGKIKKLEISGRPKYFDSILEPHDHIVCEQCRRVDHIEIEQNHTLPHEHNSGYQITGRIHYGLCPACQKEDM